ncbi:GNAT family N-acetyltransferase [Lutimonas halocynthiae]|uniref:GNAT family N-acetyltransferase n=1 Tax=Lutimonas halocynthiae TaxID=1446477 RepID=UPI0025B5D654|nr:GNAT family N-acetyltransferase [Lutimonas halocynthiae]MDN3642752.1 GNAT family N-acetyltransferase [Lutimonas halocynthiae]
MNVISTDRLLINRITLDDAGFILKLMNDKDWIKNIGDRGIRTIEETEEYIRTRFLKTYDEVGFGFYSLIRKSDQQIIGIAGLVDREGLDHIDIGYGMLPEFRGKGYAFEATKAVYDYGYKDLKLDKIIAIVNPDNPSSIKLLSKLGLEFEKMIRLPDEEIDIMLFS